MKCIKLWKHLQFFYYLHTQSQSRNLSRLKSALSSLREWARHLWINPVTINYPPCPARGRRRTPRRDRFPSRRRRGTWRCRMTPSSSPRSPGPGWPPPDPPSRRTPWRPSPRSVQQFNVLSQNWQGPRHGSRQLFQNKIHKKIYYTGARWINKEIILFQAAADEVVELAGPRLLVGRPALQPDCLHCAVTVAHEAVDVDSILATTGSGTHNDN